MVHFGFKPFPAAVRFRQWSEWKILACSERGCRRPKKFSWQLQKVDRKSRKFEFKYHPSIIYIIYIIYNYYLDNNLEYVFIFSIFWIIGNNKPNWLLNCITYGRLVWVLVFNWWLCANVFKKTTSKYTKSKLFVLNQTGWTLKIWKNKRGGIWCMPKLCMCITSCRPPADMYNQIWLGCLQLQYTGSILRKT